MASLSFFHQMEVDKVAPYSYEELIKGGECDRPMFDLLAIINEHTPLQWENAATNSYNYLPWQNSFLSPLTESISQIGSRSINYRNLVWGYRDADDDQKLFYIGCRYKIRVKEQTALKALEANYFMTCFEKEKGELCLGQSSFFPFRKLEQPAHFSILANFFSFKTVVVPEEDERGNEISLLFKLADLS